MKKKVGAGSENHRRRCCGEGLADFLEAEEEDQYPKEPWSSVAKAHPMVLSNSGPAKDARLGIKSPRLPFHQRLCDDRQSCRCDADLSVTARETKKARTSRWRTEVPLQSYGTG
jgi:hypothetical protein